MVCPPGIVTEKRDPLEVLQQQIDQRGLKLTRQRRLIAEVFFESGGHLATEEVWERVRNVDPHVSLATVYRAMKLFSEVGLASAHRFDGTTTRYEPADRRDEHHDHLICVECGKIVEFVDDTIEHAQESVAESYGFVVTHHRMELYGVCPDCQGEAKPQSSVTSM